jgi:carboxyl-terminal processing protease
MRRARGAPSPLSLILALAACGLPPPPPDDPPPDDTPPRRCDATDPDGPCPTGRVCMDGACIVDLDPGDAREEGDAAKWDQLWSIVDESYGAFPAKPSFDWGVVHDEVAAQITGATTRLQAEWAMARGVARIEDGHTLYSSTYLCELDPGFSFAISNLGACATEIDGSLFVYRAIPPGAAPTASDTGLVAGDEVLAVDGRDVEQLLADLDAQPRCFQAASTPAQLRARLVQSVLFRADTDSVITVRHADGSEEELPISFAEQVIDCDGRVGTAPDELFAGGVEVALLEGDVAFVHFPFFGSYVGNDFVDGPIHEGLRAAFEQIASLEPPARGVVLDLRNNGGGYVSVYMALASWLYDAPTPLFQCRNKSGPAHDDHGAPFSQTAEPDGFLQLDTPMVVLTGATSFSAADFTPMFLSRTGRATTMGRPTGGGFGSGSGEELGADYIGYSNILCSDLNGALLEGHPPDVDVLAEYTPEDLAAGRDTLVEAARQLLAP